MAYNLKIIEYANGQLEVITYKQGVYTMLDGESSYRADMIDKSRTAKGAIKSSETAIRKCLCKSKAFMRASVLTGLKWQYLFVKVTLFSASRYKACRTCLEDRHISVREDCYLG